MAESPEQSQDRFYDSLWEKAEAALAEQAVDLDPFLPDKKTDRRRGLSLILRPESEVVRNLEMGLRELKESEPGQYYYAAADYHVTILSLVTASANYSRTAEQLAAYARGISRAAEGFPAFEIDFRGITATTEAVMIQGFQRQDDLNRLRNEVRRELTVDGLTLQQRYAPRAAHLTVMRYCIPSPQLSALADKIRALRTKFFGTSRVATIELVENDWYMSHGTLRRVKSFSLAAGSRD